MSSAMHASGLYGPWDESRAVLHALPMAVITTNIHESVTYLNDYAARTLGRRIDECVGCAIDRLVPIPKPLRELVAMESPPVPIEVVCAVTKAEHVPATLAASPLRAPNGETHGYVCLVQPVSQMPLGMSEIQHVERLIAMGQMVAGFAHEVRNPLAALKSLVQDLVAELPDNDPRGEDVQRIEKLVRRIETLVRNSLHYVKPNTPLKESHHPAALVVAARDILAPRLLELGGGDFVLDIADDLAPVYVDDNQLVQVLIVLLNNALDATQDPTAIRIRVRKPDPSEVRSDTVGVIEIEDKGPGIPHEVLGQIFDPFFTTKPRGTGLGLSIAMRLVRENHGKLHVRSWVGVGTTFTIELPGAT